MARYRDGDEQVFPKLYHAIAPRVRGQLYAILGPDPQLEDLVQDTFLKAHAARSRFRVDKVVDDGGVTAWFCSIARNTAVNEIRRRNTAKDPKRRWAEPSPVSPSVETHAEHQLIASEQLMHTHHVVHASLHALPDSQRIVIELHKLHGIPLVDVARELGLRPGTARVRAHRGYRGLAERLRALGEPAR